MDIFFCDLCGVRVSDADLRAGHGINTNGDVICGTCLEMGHGKEWLSQRNKGKVPLAAAAKEPSMIDTARDRAMTLEDDDVEPMPDQVMVPSDAGPAAADQIEIDHVVTAKVSSPDPANVNLASAASLFSALGKQQASTMMGEEGDDLAEPSIAQDPELYQVGGASTPFSPAVDRDRGKMEKQETRAVSNNGPSLSANRDTRHKTAGRRPSPSQPSSNKPSTRIGNKTGKSSGTIRPGSGRAKVPKGVSNNQRTLIFTIISVAVMTTIFAIVYPQLRPPSGPKEQKTLDYSAKVKSKVSEAKSAAVGALRSKNASELKRAQQLLNQIPDAIEAFEVEAKRQGLTEDQINDSIDAMDVNETTKLGRLIRDELAVQSH